MKKTTPTLNIFRRFIAIWKPSYLQHTLQEEKVGGVWGFWFFWNSLFTLITSITLGVMANTWITENEPELWAEVPAFNFIFEDHVLIETGLEEPYRQDIGDDNTGDQFSFIIDRSGEKYDQSSLDVLDNVILVSSDRVFIKDQEKHKRQEIPFREIEELKNFSFDKAQAHQWIQSILPTVKKILFGGIFIGVWILLCLLRLIPLLWWSFLLWIIGKISNIQDLSFGKAYLFLMATSTIPLLIEMTLLSAGLSFGYSTLIFLGIIVAMNFYDMKKS